MATMNPKATARMTLATPSHDNSCSLSDCPVCGATPLIDRHCKRLCESCGYVESCEDNFSQSWHDPRLVARHESPKAQHANKRTPE